MKRIILVACAAFTLIATKVNAQSLKIGHINSQELLSLMPEVKKADADLKTYAKSFEDQLETMGKDYQKKIADYQGQEKTMTDAVKEVKQKEITDLGARIESTQKSAEEKVATKKQELFKPILDKAEKAIKDVAKEKGFDYVFDLSTGSVLVSRDADNMLPAVKAKLGIQ
ncbi:OmpH family outer membrane protein [Rurimicrobium arvi]|uniref:OmpH family outer membrane protein n=1 Tax=Rurimicrobium arvi TaxID=2049916 RepID=A0ABP8MTM7_9BACT